MVEKNTGGYARVSKRFGKVQMPRWTHDARSYDGPCSSSGFRGGNNTLLAFRGHFPLFLASISNTGERPPCTNKHR